MADKFKDSAKDFETALAEKGRSGYVLKLYVTGTTPKSVRAISNIQKICEEYLKETYELEVIDIYQKPELAREDQIVALPTLVKKIPVPLRRIIGDLSDKERVLVGLDLVEKEKTDKE